MTVEKLGDLILKREKEGVPKGKNDVEKISDFWKDTDYVL